MGVLRPLTLVAGLALGTAASAHVSLQPATAGAGAYQVLRFGVGHGCDGQATTALRIEIPAGTSVARPQPKPGWTLSVERAGEAVTAIVWRGELPADQFDEFLILAKLPSGEGPLAFPAIQACGEAQTGWVEVAPAGAPRPKHPAPLLTLTPAPAAAGHGPHH
ncbi:YcnI family protein [Phenylobacterium sp. CCH9-H3]|uniref:YcnI family copper-binding membrane protein n=1 Tax=Phenylobacterium sp. CCH9-H3 TaxID=1768774 RepID=UPI00083B4573|nr:YcnI family protein [Phenylobacterium sp. CCH9-H3]